MYYSPARNVKIDSEWVVTGHKNSFSRENHPLTPRALYPFRSRLRHMDFRRSSQNKNQTHDYTFPLNKVFKDTEVFPRFPVRKVPMSVKSKRPLAEFIDILGTQLMYVPNKRINRL
ncbi:hypothetical protein SteCoe_3459 [Stentor coeruleus]|uniref:Uncharacterized protein n=1 Tax=Stentor coeruleus TaxID=5963 RepID=A0A1R2CWV6_9CILI|nr:hypothetical protein SteCoe_3459 [Stentor coeruleus]